MSLPWGGGAVSASLSLWAIRMMICPSPPRSQNTEAASSSLDRNMIFKSFASAADTLLRRCR
ncbi:hypothetical protein [Nonomuraea sp. 10N515B]|uniref:hypothetical protein n=1 Tax=Nonomuraea sp. 10N515B TaxID=3457422 RepID=UPI003FCD5316